jgi:hypothetical protein
MLQRKPNRWSCAVTAFAMALGVPVEQLIREVGHDGSEIIFPDLPEPMRRRGFHSQELIEAAWKRGFACTPIQLMPVVQGPHDYVVQFGSGNWTRFTGFIDTTFGVLEGRGRRCNHAVHYRYGKVWDPDGHVYAYSREACESRGFYGNRLWVFTRTSGDIS